MRETVQCIGNYILLESNIDNDTAYFNTPPRETTAFKLCMLYIN